MKVARSPRLAASLLLAIPVALLAVHCGDDGGDDGGDSEGDGGVGV